jgi:hypothetical protein
MYFLLKHGFEHSKINYKFAFKNTIYALIIYGGIYSLIAGVLNHTPKERIAVLNKNEARKLPVQVDPYSKPIKRIKFD